MTLKPYQNQNSKKQQVEEMFNNISGKYDFLNHFLSAGIDKKWRKKVRNIIEKNLTHLPIHQQKSATLLDLATGTGDLCIELAKIENLTITGADLSQGMLNIAQEKVNKKNLHHRIELIKVDAEKMPFNDNSFDVVTVAFGVRNFENLEQGLTEIKRVLKPEGKIVVLEFSNPEKFPIKQAFNLYSGKIMPTVGSLFSKDKKAYQYLHESSRAFPNGKKFTDILEKLGFSDTQIKPLSMGIASIYQATK